jgi:LPXTG-motif cell wall-anchored protein
MARPQAKKTAAVRRRTTRQTGPSSTVWLLAAIIVALFILGLLYLAKHKPQHQPSEKPKPTKTAVKHTASKQLTSKETSPQFDFYTMLPDMQVEEAESIAKASLILHSYILQAGAFKHYADADKVRAKLILQGYNAQIKPVEVKGITWQRITLGPFKTLTEAQQVQDKLAKQGMKSLLFQIS